MPTSPSFLGAEPQLERKRKGEARGGIVLGHLHGVGAASILRGKG